MEQIKPFSPGFTLGERAESIEKRDDGTFIVTTNKGTKHQAPVVAIAGGATEVVNIDMARGALKHGQRNHELNGFSAVATRKKPKQEQGITIQEEHGSGHHSSVQGEHGLNLKCTMPNETF